MSLTLLKTKRHIPTPPSNYVPRPELCARADAGLRGRLTLVAAPVAMTMKVALTRYCRVFHPEVGKVPVIPIWLAKLMGGLTGNEILKFASGLMGYFDKTPETGDSSEADQILGAPETTLDPWIAGRKSNPK